MKIEDVNDNPPVFLQHQYSANIVETIPYKPPAPIVQLHAEDKDEKTRLRYSIVNGNDEGIVQNEAISLFCLPLYYILLVYVLSPDLSIAFSPFQNEQKLSI